MPWAKFWLVEKVLEIIPGFCATLSAISCIYLGRLLHDDGRFVD